MSVQRVRESADPGAEPSVPGFAVLGRVGRGAGTTVWSARDLDSGKVYALKVAAPTVGGRPAAAARAEAREISLLRRLDHPHLVRLHRVVDLADGRRALVLDLAEIGSLAELVADRGPLDEGEACRFLAPVAQALAHLHSRGVVHGDVSDGNILIGAGGRPLLGDLGVARLLPAPGRSAEPETGSHAAAYETPGFGAPELAAGGRSTTASDVWSLGAVLRASLGPETGALGALVTACAAADPAARPTADQVERVLRLASSGEPLNPRPVPSIDRAPTRHAVAARGSGAPGPASPAGPRRWSWLTSRAIGATARLRRARLPLRVVVPGLLLAATVSGWCLADAGARAAAPPPEAPPAGESSDPVSAVHRLAATRADVLNSGSESGLAAVDLPGSPAWRADAALLSRLSRSGVRVQGLRFRVDSARLVRWEDDKAVVRTRIEVSAHRRVGAAAGAEQVPASGSRIVDLVLQPDSGGNWRVGETLPPPAPEARDRNDPIKLGSPAWARTRAW